MLFQVRAKCYFKDGFIKPLVTAKCYFKDGYAEMLQGATGKTA